MLSCGGPLPAREGKFVLKYFLLREAVAPKNRGAGASSGTNEKPQSKIAGASHYMVKVRFPAVANLTPNIPAR
jgi:hypothetical protein